MWNAITASGQRYCVLNGVCYIEQYEVGTHSKRTVLLWVECSVLQ